MAAPVLHVFSIDTETTGLRNKFSPPGIIDFSAVDTKKHELDPVSEKGFECYSTLIRSTIAIPADASAIHGIFPADVADAPSLEEAWKGFLGWVDQRLALHYGPSFQHWQVAGAGAIPSEPAPVVVRVVLLAYNGVAFDFPVICGDLARAKERVIAAGGDADGLGIPPSWGFADLLLHVRGSVKWGINDVAVPSSAEARARKLGLLFEHLFGFNFEDAHRAEADAVALAKVYLRVLETDGVGFSERYPRPGAPAVVGAAAATEQRTPFRLRIFNSAELFEAGPAALSRRPRVAGAGAVAATADAKGEESGSEEEKEEEEDSATAALGDRLAHALTIGGGVGAAPPTAVDIEGKTKGTRLHADSPLTEIKGVGSAVAGRFAKDGGAATIREAIAFLKSPLSSPTLSAASVWSPETTEADAISALASALLEWLAMGRFSLEYATSLAAALVKVNKKLLMLPEAGASLAPAAAVAATSSSSAEV